MQLPGVTDYRCGWMLDEGDPAQPNRHEASLCDCNSLDPDMWFGPAKWPGLRGPRSARRLLRVQMVGYYDWRGAVANFAYGSGVRPGPGAIWPGEILVTAYGANHGLARLQGQVVQSLAEFSALIAPIVAALESKAVVETSPAGRLAAVEERFPHLATPGRSRKTRTP